MSYQLVGKIQVPEKYTKDPVNNGLVKQKYGLDFKIMGPDGELHNDEVIDGGFAYKSRIGFRNKDTGEELFFEGRGAQEEDGEYKRVPEGEEHEDRAIPNDGYLLEGPGISAILDSNGLRLVQNFKKLPDGCYEAFGSVEGVGTATFKHGNTICVGAASARKHGGRRGDHP